MSASLAAGARSNSFSTTCWPPESRVRRLPRSMLPSASTSVRRRFPKLPLAFVPSSLPIGTWGACREGQEGLSLELTWIANYGSRRHFRERISKCEKRRIENQNPKWTAKVSRSFAIIPAAGHSIRMGQPKLLMPLEGRPLILHVLAAWLASKSERVVVVVRPDDADLAEVTKCAGAEVVVPAMAPLDMKASLAHGLEHISARY